jgi:transposase-like protein
MSRAEAIEAPPFCPNPNCHFHRHARASWRWNRAGFYARHAAPQRIQRFQCGHCRRHFSAQTFRTSYWLKRPELLPLVFHRLLGCSGFRQIAREFRVSPQTVLGLSARLGRHCLLFHERLRPRGPLTEALALDGFQSFEHSQFHPTLFHVVVGRRSHYFYGFSDSELRRSGRMTGRQRRQRARLEQRCGRPQPRAGEREVAAVLEIVTQGASRLRLDTDEHTDYPRALQRLGRLEVEHHTISSRAARTAHNPLFPVNLLDLLIRHCGANHKRETIAYSKRRQSAAERLWVFLVWRNYLKSFSERRRDGSPAMRLGLLPRRLGVTDVLQARLFPTRLPLPERWARYYWRQVLTRTIPHCSLHQRAYAF